MDDLDIFLNAPKDASPEELAAYLDEACGGDADLRARVEKLFESDQLTRALVDEAPVVSRGEAPPVPLAPGTTIGSYKLLQCIGEGGFGVVYMAEQTQPVRRRVALKIIKQGMDTRQVIARFEAERQALAMMEHPNIAKVLDAGATEAGRPYFVMELVRGTPITKFCDEESLDNHQRLALFKDVCSAVGHAHQKGIIHRDLKPSNILVGLDGDTPIVKVIDFGVAKATQLQLTDKTLFTRFEQFIGTPLYISPEQASLSPIDIDTRSDIYSLGVLLYELLTGKPPIDSDELMKAGFDEMRRLIREQEPPKPSTRLATSTAEERRSIAKARHTEPRQLGLFIKGDLDWIVLKALEKDRKRRYDTADALRRDIEHFLKDEVVTATPPSAIYKFQKFARRNKGALVGATAVFLALLAGAIVSTSQWFRAEDAAKQAKSEAAAAEEARGAEETQRALAEKRLQESARSDRVTAKDLAANGRELEAMAYLARSSRNDPEATEAFEASIELLRGWNHPRAIAQLDEPLAGTISFVEEEKVAWSASGALVAVADTERGMGRAIGRVWNCNTGEVVLSFVPESDNETVAAVQFDGDGNCLMLVCPFKPEPGGSVRVWDSGSRSYRATLVGAGSERLSFGRGAFSGDGALVLFEEAMSSESGDDEAPPRIGVWKTADGTKVASLPYEGGLTMARFSADGTRVLSTHGTKTIVWDIATSEPIATAESDKVSEDGSLAVIDGDLWSTEQDCKLHALESVAVPELKGTVSSGSGATTGVVGYIGGRVFKNETSGRFSPDGLRFAGFTKGSSDYCVWDTETGRLLQSISRSARGTVGSPDPSRLQYQHQFSGDGLLLATFHRGQTKIWNTHTGDLLATIPVGGARLSPDGRRIMTRDLQIWEWTSQGLDRPLPPGPHGITPDGRLIRTVGSTIRISSVEEGRELARLDSSLPITSSIKSESISKNGRFLVTTHPDRVVQVWNLETGNVAYEWRIEQGKSATGPFFSPDGGTLGVWVQMPSKTDPDGKSIWQALTVFYDLETGELRGQLPSLVGPYFSPDGTRIVVEAERAKISVYATDGLELLKEYPLPENSHSRSMAFRPDGSGPLVLTDEGEIIDLETGKPALAGKLENFPSSFSFSPDGKQMAVHYYRSEMVKVFEVASGKELGMQPRTEWEEQSELAWALEGERGSYSLRLRLESPPVVPGWWGDFLELVGHQHFNDLGEVTSLPMEKADEMRSKLLATLAEDDTRVAEVVRWWLAPSDQRGVHVGSSLSAAGFADQLIRTDAAKKELEQAYRLNSGHPLIHLALATTVESEVRAQFLADYSRRRLPDDPEMRRRAREWEETLQAHLVRVAAEKAVKSGMDLKSEGAQEIFAKLGTVQLGEATDSLELLRTAVVLALGESTERYEQFCREFARVHGEDDDQVVRKRLRLAAMVLDTPTGRTILEELPSLHDPETAPTWSPRWFDFTKALGAYRQGDGRKAIEHLKRDPEPLLDAKGIFPILFSLVEAMAQQQTGNTEDAQRLLTEARNAMPAMQEKNPIKSGRSWQDRVLCELLLEEAEGVIEAVE